MYDIIQYYLKNNQEYYNVIQLFIQSNFIDYNLLMLNSSENRYYTYDHVDIFPIETDISENDIFETYINNYCIDINGVYIKKIKHNIETVDDIFKSQKDQKSILLPITKHYQLL